MSRRSTPHTPTFPEDYVDRLRRWHEAAYEEMRQRGKVSVSYLGRQFEVPEDVFAPTPMSDLLGRAVLDDVRAGDRVLDMGTGCGANAILAASKSSDVIGVDISSPAVASARANATRNGVDDRTRFFVSDVFDAVKGTFDLVVFDPPFRWFRPRDILEANIADENYQALTRFIEQVSGHMKPASRVLLSFGTSGDIDYLSELIEREDLVAETLEKRQLEKDDLTITYSAQRLRLPNARNSDRCRM